MIPKNPIQPLISEEMLGAYLDNELDELRRMEVEANLAANLEAANFVSAGIGLRSRLHLLFDSLLARPLPAEQERLIREFEGRIRSSGRRHRFRPAIYAGAMAAVLAVFGVFVFPYLSRDGTGQQLFALFQQQQNAEKVATGSTGPDRQPTAETTAKAGNLVPVDVEKTSASSVVAALPKSGAPDFSEFGFELISTRLLAKTDNRSMQLIYEGDQGSRVELFFSPQAKTADKSGAKTSLTVMEEGPISVLFWNDNGRAYSLIGDVDRDTLLGMGQLVNGQWTLDLSASDPSVQSGGEPKMEAQKPAKKPVPDKQVPRIKDAERPAAKPDGAKLPVDGDEDTSKAAET